MADFGQKRESVAKLHHFTKRWTAQPRVNFDGGWKSRLWVKFALFQDKADISESTTGAFPAHNTKDFQGHQHQQHQHQQGSQVQQGGGNISSSASPSMKQPGQQEGGGGPTGQHANVIIPRGGRRPSGKQVRLFFLGGGEKVLIMIVFFSRVRAPSLTVLTLALSLRVLFLEPRLFLLPIYSKCHLISFLSCPVLTEPSQVFCLWGISLGDSGREQPREITNISSDWFLEI